MVMTDMTITPFQLENVTKLDVRVTIPLYAIVLKAYVTLEECTERKKGWGCGGREREQNFHFECFFLT